MTARRPQWMRLALVLIAVTWSVAAVVAQCWLPQPGRDAAHPSHPLAAAVGSEFAINMDHAHFSDNSTPPCPLDFATAPLPRTATTALAFDVMPATTGVTDRYADLVVLAGRGPPGASGWPRSGRDLLTHYCVARR